MDFTEDDVAAVYDLQNPWRPWPGSSDAVHTEFAMAARSILDVGCGTGQMLHYLRDHGHTGRLVGIDPDVASLNRARRREDLGIEWVEGTAADVAWKQEFELATMASNAFQCLVEDNDLRASLAAIHAALAPGGRFVFETRHPQARAWEEWAAAEPDHFDYAGRPLVMSWNIEAVADGVVTMTETTSDSDGTVLHSGRGRLRFLSPAELNARLADAGFAVDEQYGDFGRGPLTPESRTIVTVARA
ncbi:MAG TPA: class I SAM-dependent methyltransferase [Actinospica sp.]|jgi:SAM-dependent methyltransferase|nr:class I SAM-dependent methyltransferase [Actinospica sp.]